MTETLVPSNQSDVTLLTEAECSPAVKVTRGRPSQADLLVELVEQRGIELVHDDRQVAYAITPQGNGVRGVYPITSRIFRGLLSKSYRDQHGKVPNGAAIKDAIVELDGEALHNGRLVTVALRVSGDDQSICLDLGDDQWRMVRISEDGWDIVPHGNCLFRRAPGMLALPIPVSGGALTELRRFLRVDDEGFATLLAFVLCAIRGRGPYPTLIIGGEHGAAKTTTARIINALVDPHRSPSRADCSDTRDLAIAANNAHLLAFDNLSTISPKMSDALCRLSTGGGFTTRQLYTDQDEVIFEAQRPVIIASIVEVVNRPDLLDRCLKVYLQAIRDHERQDEGSFWATFEAARPRLLGAILDAASVALRNFVETRRSISDKPRMADAYIWTLSAESTFGLPAGTLERAWQRTREEANAAALESSIVADPLRRFLEPLTVGDTWSGTASDLLHELANVADETTRRRREWPKAPRSLAGDVRRLAPALRSIGIDHYEDRKPHSGDRLHFFTKSPTENPWEAASPASPSSPSSAATGSSAADTARLDVGAGRSHSGEEFGDDGDDDILLLDVDGAVTGAC